MPRPRALAATLLLGGLAWLMVGTGFVNYDTAYTLVWGSELAHGGLPDYRGPVAPTPHPLSTLVAAALAPLGSGAETVAVALAVLFIGALGYLAYALGREWFGRGAGLLAAAIVLTREPILSFGIRAYVDLPYLVLVLAAGLAEARRPRAGRRVLVLLALAGLLRPEAWLFSFAYVGWMALDPAHRRPAALLRLLALAASAPVLWALSDLIVTGNPLYSLTGTREGAEVLRRITGLDDVPLTVPRRIGEILREPVLLGAALGLGLGLWRLRARTAPPAAIGVVALLAFCCLAAAGLPILGRYLLLPATLGAILCGAGVFGWRRLARDDPWRRPWQVGAAVVVVALLAFLPGQVDRIEGLRRSIATQRTIVDDLRAIAAPERVGAACGPVAVPNHRPVPLLALWLDRPPREIVSAQLRRPGRGSYLDPASRRVERNFTLDPNDPQRLTATVPPGFAQVSANGSWRLWRRCG